MKDKKFYKKISKNIEVEELNEYLGHALEILKKILSEPEKIQNTKNVLLTIDTSFRYLEKIHRMSEDYLSEKEKISGKFIVPVKWSSYGFAIVDNNIVDTPKKAVEYVRNNVDKFSLPKKAYYVEDSFEVTDYGSLEEDAAMCEIFTEKYRKGEIKDGKEFGLEVQ